MQVLPVILFEPQTNTQVEQVQPHRRMWLDVDAEIKDQTRELTRRRHLTDGSVTPAFTPKPLILCSQKAELDPDALDFMSQNSAVGEAVFDRAVTTRAKLVKLS